MSNWCEKYPETKHTCCFEANKLEVKLYATEAKVRALKAEQENLIMNLAACSTYAMGYALDEPAPGLKPRRAAVDDVLKLRRMYEEAKSRLALAEKVVEAGEALLKFVRQRFPIGRRRRRGKSGSG